jgi:ferredoxin
MSFLRNLRTLRPFLLSQKKKIVTPQQMSFVTSKFLHKRAEVSVTFIRLDGTKLPAKGKEGENLLDIIIDQEIDIDGFGACEGTLACSTCHLIFKQTDFDKIPDEATDEELDMLDLAYGLTDTSRLGCQVCLTKELEGLEVQVPEGINDQR